MSPTDRPPWHKIEELVDRALAEDVGPGDASAELIAAETTGEARLITREAGILCGAPWAEVVFQRLDPAISLQWETRDGDAIARGDLICRLSGPVRALLSGERTAINLLQTLSGTATATRRYVEAVAGTGATILDSRKTLPGLREAQKYAVRCGGGQNHRMGLYDGIMLKENHIAACGDLASAVANALSAAEERQPPLPVTVEVEQPEQAATALDAGARWLLLDNFSIDDLRRVVGLNRGRARLEASGGIALEQIRQVAETGVDYISVGALTKHLHALDLSLRLDRIG